MSSAERCMLSETVDPGCLGARLLNSPSRVQKGWCDAKGLTAAVSCSSATLLPATLLPQAHHPQAGRSLIRVQLLSQCPTLPDVGQVC